MSKLKVGIVGAGSIAELHALGYEHDDRAEIVAICDPDEDLAIKRALDWGARAYYTNFDQMLADPKIDAVEILTPNHLHAEQAIKALQAGKHVCVERPIAISIEDARRVQQAAAASRRVLQVYEPSLYYKPLLDARSLIDAGEVGEVTGLRVDAVVGQSEQGKWDFTSNDQAWRFDPAKAGGTPMLYEVGYQAFCIGLFLVGSIEKVSAWSSSSTLKNGRVIDAPTVAMWKHFEQESYGTLHLTYAPDRVMRSGKSFPIELDILVSGTRGEIRIIRSPDAGRPDAPVELRRSNRRVNYGQRTTFEDSFIRATKNFISACLGKEEPLLRGAEAQQLLVLTLAYHEAAKRGRAISLQHG